MIFKTTKIRKIITYILILACISTCLFVVDGDMNNGASEVVAKDSFSSEFMQRVYNLESGLGSVEVNVIYQTRSGYIWVGTDGGLYRYNGKEFKVFNLWDTEKDDVYCINALFQDSTGRLWIGTDNYGLFFIKGSKITHFTDDYYNGIKSINDICESDNGTIFVSSRDGLYRINEENQRLETFGEELKGHDVTDIEFYDDMLWGICAGNELFLVDAEEKIDVHQATEYSDDNFTCLYKGYDAIYVGTFGNEIIRFASLRRHSILVTSNEGINSIYQDNTGRIFALFDNGFGYFDGFNSFNHIQDTEIDSFFSSMIVDYEGNYWFSSSRKGILYLGFSKFSNFGEKYGVPDNTTNCIITNRGDRYIGTDQGLYIVNGQNELEDNELTEKLKDVSIRDMLYDSEGNLWVCTFRKFGLVKCQPDGNISTFGKISAVGTNFVNTVIELKNHNFAVGTEEGLVIIDKNGNLVKRYDVKDGLLYPNILAIYQDDAGRILAGSDGGGLYVIEGDKITNFSDENELNTNVVSNIEAGENGIYLGTDNGVSLYNDTIRALSNIDFSNNVYDIIIRDGDVYVIGSKGVLKTTEEALIGAEEIEERYWSKSDGLARGITIGSKSCIDESGILYISCDQGVYTLDASNIPVNEVPPKLTVSEIDVDGEVYSFDQIGGSLTVPSDVTKITIYYGVLSYSNREYTKVSYFLNGFDKEPIVINATDNMQAVYTNLEGGQYVFTLSAVNSDGTESQSTVEFTIDKQFGLFEFRFVRIGFIVLAVIIAALAIFIIYKYKNVVTGKEKEIEELSKEHEVVLKSSTAKTDYLANMSNEIKVPVNAMIKLAEKVSENGELPPESINDLATIIQSGNDIIEKVDDIILLAKLESGRIKPVNATYSITTLVCDLSDKIISLIDDRPVKFFVELGEDIPDILIGDFDKIKQVLTIILDNAQKFTKEGSVILSVDSYEYNGDDVEDNDVFINLVFSISDTGIGIQEERLEHIFEVYNIADNKKLSGYSGSGTSLAIAKKFTEILEGELNVESTYGSGSLFTFSVIQKKAKSAVATVTDESMSTISKEEAEHMWTPDITALLVDDVPVNVTVALSVMNQLEMKVDVATSSMSAIDMVINNHYDIVLMDMTMPVMNGTDAMKEIRELEGEEYKTLPIIAMTDDAIGEDRDKVMALGFTDMIIKPFDIRTFAAVIQNYVPSNLIKHRTSNMAQYIKESRFSDGITALEEHIDVPRILEKIGGSIEVYNKLLSTFYNQNVNAEAELREKYEHDYRGFKARIHNIKTGSINIGAMQVSAVASKIEAAVNIGNRDYVRDNLSGLLDILRTLLDSISEYLDFVDKNKGLTDEEYAERLAREKELAKEIEMMNQKEGEGSDDIVLTPADGEGAVSQSGAVNAGGSIGTGAGVGGSSGVGNGVTGTGDSSENGESGKETVPAKQTESRVIDITMINDIQEYAQVKDIAGVKELFELMTEFTYVREDTDFLEVLGEAVEKSDFDQITELITTYKNLKAGNV